MNLPRLRLSVGFLFLCVMAVSSSRLFAQDEEKKPEAAVSYYRQIRPIMQRHCSGCHQPAKLGGKLLLTSFEGFRKGGESGESFTPGKPDESLILDYISGDEPEMPLNQEPLKKEQVALIARWIQEGAKDDTPETAKDTITAENPPKYENAPVITALAYSPDGTQLAVSGFHETLIHKSDGSGLISRLVGRSQRIENVQFSSDGKMLAVTGGSPALFGEVQFWDVTNTKLVSSLTIGFDTLFGGSFNKDGSQFAFGAGDNRARVITVKDGKQIMRFDAHSDFVLDTAFSLADDHLISVSRDMSMKLMIIKSAQFVDNITSITPGALKGGLMAVQRHPLKEQVLAGGADGVPKLFKIFRTRKRIIGDDFNLIRSYEKLPGRIFDLALSGDGTQFVVGSSTATGGAARIYKTGVFDEKTINNSGGLGQVRQEVAKRSAEKALVHELQGTGPVFAVAFRPDGKQVAVGGFDGQVRLFNTADGKLVKQFVPVSVMSEQTAAK